KGGNDSLEDGCGPHRVSASGWTVSRCSRGGHDGGAVLVTVTGTLRVVVGEDSYLVREGIVRSLQQRPNLDVLAAEADLGTLRAAIERLEPDVVITDIRMPPTTTDEGIQLALELQRTRPRIAVVVLSQVANVGYAS